MTFAHTLRIQPDFRTAADRACDNQKNNCAEIANSPTGTFEVRDCDKQNGGFHTLRGKSGMASRKPVHANMAGDTQNNASRR